MDAKNRYPLDCVGAVLPYTISKTRPLVFRLMVVLKKKVNPDDLRQAVRDLAPRFPTLYARLCKGFWWDHLVPASDYDIVVKDDGCPCRPFNVRDKAKPLFRVLYRENEVGIESTHLTNDGGGATIYLNSLIARYVEIGMGWSYTTSHNVLHYRDVPQAAELEDSYRRVYNETPKTKAKLVSSPGWLYRQKRQRDYLQVTNVAIPIDAMKALLKEKYGGCTITEYLLAVYACAFFRLPGKGPTKRKPLRLSVPNDLRSYWGSTTMRNFVSSEFIEIVPERQDAAVDAILAIVRREMKEKMSKAMQTKFVCQVVRYLEMPLIKILPGFVKRAVLSVAYLFSALVWQHVSTLSNVGYVKLPPALAAQIESYHAIMGEGDVNRIYCAAAGINNVMSVAFSAVNQNSVIQDFCVDFFRKDGLPVEVTVRDR